MISLSAVALILFGAVGAVISSLFIKRTRNYKFLLTVLTFTTTGTLILFALQLYILPTAALSIIVVGVIGFFVVPVIPTSYEIGC
jgi:preprotein translocase subunit Sss1